jgi:C-terminal processing protease CtpA/Prc
MKKIYFFLILCFIGLIGCQTKYARNDAEFNKGSKIDSINLTPSKTDDLVILGKIWGFLKYYHPNIAKGEHNWDYELFRILPQIINCRDNNERNNILSKWIKTFGEFELREVGILDSTKTKIKPDLAWISDQSLLGRKLSKQLIHIQDAKRISNYYVSFVSGVGNPDFKNELSYYEIKKPDGGYRLLALFRYWNIIEYYFPYKNLIEENWNNVLKEFIPKFIHASNEIEYKLVLMELVARVHDSHAHIFGPDEALRRYWGIYHAPIGVTFIENKVVVTDFFEKTLGKKSGFQLGDIIKSINHKPVEEIIKEQLKFTSASNNPTKLRNIALTLLRSNDSTMNIEFNRNGKSYSTQIEMFLSDKLNFSSTNQNQDTCFKLINSNIGYLSLGSLKNKYLSQIMDSVQNTKGLIIDLRCYPYEFVVYSLAKYLMPQRKSFVKLSKGSISNPGLFTFTNQLFVGTENKNYFKGKVVILINDVTESNAEFAAMAFRISPRAIVLGSTTSGADGNVSLFYLPSGICTSISGIGVYYPDGKETQRIGIVPDIVVKPTIKGIIENRDELVEKAKEIINN